MGDLYLFKSSISIKLTLTIVAAGTQLIEYMDPTEIIHISDSPCKSDTVNKPEPVRSKTGEMPSPSNPLAAGRLKVPICKHSVPKCDRNLCSVVAKKSFRVTNSGVILIEDSDDDDGEVGRTGVATLPLPVPGEGPSNSHQLCDDTQYSTNVNYKIVKELFPVEIQKTTPSGDSNSVNQGQ